MFVACVCYVQFRDYGKAKVEKVQSKPEAAQKARKPKVCVCLCLCVCVCVCVSQIDHKHFVTVTASGAVKKEEGEEKEQEEGERETEKPESSQQDPQTKSEHEDSLDVLTQLTKFIYNCSSGELGRIRTRAMLCQIYHHALHDRYRM